MNVDKGFAIIGGTTGEETSSQGLDGLAERCQGYYARGVRFCKWRSVVKCHRANGGPSELALNETAHTLARYASIAQDNGLVPIIEPEVSLDGDHTLEECEAVSEMINSRVMQQMQAHKLIIEGTIIKPNMVTPGAQYTGPKPSREEIAQATVRALGRAYVPAIPGIMFLSGGQSEQDACLNLNAINQTGMKTPWAISFSYGRALQASVLEAWKGNNVEAG
jgi:fructose-bisphosphate aldolase class I